jgi:hypothetical protein
VGKDITRNRTIKIYHEPGLKNTYELGMGAPTCNPSYSGGRGRKDCKFEAILSKDRETQSQNKNKKRPGV